MKFYCLGVLCLHIMAREQYCIYRSVACWLHKADRKDYTIPRRDNKNMFNTSWFFQLRKEHCPDTIDQPFGSEIFAMMAASTFGLAFGGPDRMFINHGQQQSTNLTDKAMPTAPAGGGLEVKGWLFYDPIAETFRQSPADQEGDDEDIAARTLVDACESAMEDDSTTTCGCDEEDEEEYEEEHDEHEDCGDLNLLKSSFSFVVSTEPFTPSPSVSPFSDAHGDSDTNTSTTTKTSSDDEYLPKIQAGQTSSVSDSDDASKSTLPPSNTKINDRQTSSLTFFPPLRGSRLGSHRGSVMEAGVVLDTRTFGGIGVVQNGRKVDVRKSVGGVHLKASG